MDDRVNIELVYDLWRTFCYKISGHPVRKIGFLKVAHFASWTVDPSKYSLKPESNFTRWAISGPLKLEFEGPGDLPRGLGFCGTLKIEFEGRDNFTPWTELLPSLQNRV